MLWRKLTYICFLVLVCACSAGPVSKKPHVTGFHALGSPGWWAYIDKRW